MFPPCGAHSDVFTLKIRNALNLESGMDGKYKAIEKQCPRSRPPRLSCREDGNR